MCSAKHLQLCKDETQGFNIVDTVEELLASISKRNMLWKKAWKTWVFTLYLGPSLESDDSNVISLEYTLLAKTNHADSATQLDLETGCSPVRVSYKNTIIVS